MALRPCSACQKRVEGKLASVYWSWNLEDRSRVAYLQRLCITCFVIQVLPFEEQDFSDTLMCPSCHTPSGDDMQPVFAKVYMPGHSESALELPTCSNCAAMLREQAQTGAERLPDRGTEFGGQAPKLSATSVWDSLGLRPD